MEIKEYWEIVKRRVWLVVALTFLAFAVSLGASMSFAAAYKASVRFAVKPEAESRSSTYYSYDEYYAYVASEYLIDDVIEMIESKAFRDELLERLRGRVVSLPDKSIEGKKAHRVLIVNVTTGSKESAQLVAETIAVLLTEQTTKYFGKLSWQNPSVTVVDPPNATQVGEGRRSLDIGLRTLLGLIAGLGLAFLVDYLDGTLTAAQQVERLVGLPVLGEIPRQKGVFTRR